MELQKYEDLKRIGLTDGEAKVYVALLELGPSSVGPITKRTKVSYSNIYEILDRLITKGIVSIIIKNNIKNFQPVTPENLSKYLDLKEQEVREQRTLLKKALPRIEALQETYPKQEAQMFIGMKGLRAAYVEFFKGYEKGDENLWIYVHDDAYAEISDKFYLGEWAKIVGDIPTRGIGNESYRNSEYMKVFKKKYEPRFVDFPVFSHGEVFKDRFLLVSWDDPITVVLVEAKHVADNFRKYFNNVWEKAKR